MANQVKKKPVSNRKLSLAEKRERNLKIYMWAIPALAFIIKMITVSNTKSGAWMGADGENYIIGVNALIKDGVFSKADILNYWPAGYPLLLFPFGKISAANFLYFISFVQSLFFAYSTYFLAERFRRHGLKFLAFTTVFILSFNPTLSLATLAIGYEAPVASCLMMVIGVLLSREGSRDFKVLSIGFVAIGAWIGLASFMQPRYLVAGFAIMALWALAISPTDLRLKVISIGIVALLISPLSLVARNVVATNKATISTNLGVTMRIGAGDETTGGYKHQGVDVPCEGKVDPSAPTDGEIVKCVVKWYLTHPVKTLKLAYFKSLYFWSPWTGPLGNGTMARNPSLKISPTQNISLTPSGRELIVSGFGVIISSLWVLGELALLFIGFVWLRRVGGRARFIAPYLLTPVILGWLISIATIGDHRFRVPTMSLSLILQVAGLFAVRYQFKTNKLKWQN